MFRRYGAGQRASFVLAVVLLAVESGTAIVLPTLIGSLIDFLKGGTAWQPLGLRFSHDLTVPLLAVSLVVITAANSLADSLAEISLAKAGRTLGYNLRTSLFSHLQRLSLAFHVRRSTGDVLTRITGDVQALEEFVTESVSDLVGSIMLLAGTLTFLFWRSWQIATLAVIIVPLLAIVSRYFARRIKASSKEQRAREGDLATTAQEMLSTISVVQIYGRTRHEQRKFAAENRSAMNAVLRTARLEALFGFTVSLLEALVIAVVVLIGARLVDASVIQAGLLVSFILLIQGMFKPTRRIIKEWNTVGKIYASVERIGELLDREPAVGDLEGARPAPPLTGAVEFRDVSFAYQSATEGDADGPSRLTLQSLSFSLEAGDVVALVGHSGAGKSTIAQLLPRLYDPQAGAVLMDGHDIRSFTIDSLRAQISMVLQETILLRGTVADNIAYGREGATFEDVVTAAQRAQAHDFINAMPQGYDTVLGERAATLSGGQRQRLAIARAFIRDTPILVLDEPTTGLDAQSSALVTTALQSLLRGRSAVIVSHDLNLIRAVDRILVLSAGRVLEEGTPADLLARGGLYADLYASQFGEAVADAMPDGVRAALPAGVPSSARTGPPADLHSAVEDGAMAARAGAQAREAVPVGADAGGPGGASVDRASEFETVLMEAVPLPASREEFAQLTGWGAAAVGDGRGGAYGSGPSTGPSSVDGDLDPLRSPALHSALPGLREALDPAAMAPRLQGLLADGWALDSCVPGRVVVDPQAGAALRYRLRLRRRDTGALTERLVGGHLFGSDEGADDWLSRLVPMADEVEARDDVSVFAQVADCVRPLHLVLHAFPLDPELPGLVAATDPLRMAGLLEPALPSSLRGLILQGCSAEVVRYVAGHRCVLRYELLWRLEPSRRTVKQVLYGKAYADDRGALIGPTVTAFREHVRTRTGGSFPFLLPRFEGYLPQLRLALLEALPGTPLLPTLVRDHVAGGLPLTPRPPTAEGALRACARIAAALHASTVPGSALPGGHPRTLTGEVVRLRAEVEAVAPLAPDLARTVHARLDDAAAAAREEPLPFGPAHGDLTPSEVLLDGPISSLFDLDSACVAEPALDVGGFLGHLDVVTTRARHATGHVGSAVEEPGNGPGEALDRVFLEEYLRAGGPDVDQGALAARIAAYRTVTLAQVAVRSWCQLKPDRLRAAIALLEQPDRAAAQRVPAVDRR
jgi:ABC-type multidrug transport system fused ATPase/permease subunit